MAIQFADRVRCNTATTGTGTITIGAAVSGYRTFAQAVTDGQLTSGSTIYYGIQDNANWECGSGIYTSGAETLTRIVGSSSAGGTSALTLSGSAQIFLTLTAGSTVTAVISAGTINNAIIGATTAVAGTFSNLTATGTTNLNATNIGTAATATLNVQGGNAGSFLQTNGIAISTTISQTGGVATAITSIASGFATADVIVIAGATPAAYNGAVVITVVDSVTFTYTIAGGTSSPATGAITSIRNTNSVYFKNATGFLGQFSSSAGATATVNSYNFTAGATGISPVINIIGSDTNLSLTFKIKGTGVYTFFNNTANLAPLVIGQLSIGNSASSTLVSGVTPPAFFLKNNLTGNLTANLQNYMSILVPADTVTCTGTSQGVAMLQITDFCAAGATGARWMIDTWVNNSGVPGTGANQSLGGIRSTNISTFNMNGTGFTSGQPASGSIWGTNIVVNQLTGSTYLISSIGTEIDIAVSAGASVLDKIGMQICQLPNDINPGNRSDVGLSFNNSSLGSAGWNNIIGIGREIGNFPCHPGTTILGIVPNVTAGNFVPTYQANYGIDFRPMDFTTAAFASPGFVVNQLGAAQVGAGALTPTTTGLSLDVTGQYTATMTVNAAGSSYNIGDQFWVPTTGVIGQVTGITGGGILSVTSLTQTSGTATATTSVPHTYTTGDIVVFAGVTSAIYATPSVYNNLVTNNGFTITVTSTTTFTFAIASGTATPATGTITVQKPGAPATLSILVPGYTQSGAGSTTNLATVGGSGSGALTVNLTWTASTTLALNPSAGATTIGALLGGNYLTVAGSVSNSILTTTGTLFVTTLTQSASVATATTTLAHGYFTGDSIIISGASLSAYNGTFVITVTSTTTFTYAITGTPATPIGNITSLKNSGGILLKNGTGILATFSGPTTTTANNFNFQAAATGVSPVINIVGSDTNLGLVFKIKGTGVYTFFNNTATLSPIIVGQLNVGNSTTTTYSGAGTGVNSGIYLKNTLTGNVTSGGQAYMTILAPIDTITCANIFTGVSMLSITDTCAAGATGSRWMIDLVASNSGVPGAGPPPQGLGGLRSTSVANFNMNGTGFGTNQPSGTLWGYNGVVHALAGATYLVGACGIEIDISCAAGASMQDKIGIQIVQLSDDINPGNRSDVALSFNNQAGPGWNNIIGIGREIGSFPCHTGTTILGIVPNTTVSSFVPAYQANYGIDFRPMDFTTAAFASPGFVVNQLGAAQVGAGALTPTTTGLSLDVTGQYTATMTVNTAGSSYVVNDQFWVPTAGVIGQVTGITGGGILSVTSLTQTAGTATATTSVSHTYTTGDVIMIAGVTSAILFTPSPYNTNTLLSNGFTITVTGATTFTFAIASSTVSPAVGTITAQKPGPVASVAILVPGYTQSGAGPTTNLAILGGSGNGIFTVNLTWTATTTLALSPSAGATTVGGTLGVTGNSTLANTAITNLTSTSSSNALVIKNGPAGTVMMTIGGTTSNVILSTNLQLPGGTWGSGALVNGVAPIYQNVSFAGTNTNAAGAFGAFLQQSDNSSNVNQGCGFYEKLTLTGSGCVGGRVAGSFDLVISATTGNVNGQQYVGLIGKSDLMATDGGSVIYSTSFGANFVAHVGTGVTAESCTGTEINTWVETGSVVLRHRIGLQVVDVTGSTFGGRGSQDDVAISMNNQYAPSSTLGFLVGLGFGRKDGNFPVGTTGTLIYGQALGATGFTVANGIDWSLGTFTGNSWNDGHTTIDGSGNIKGVTFKVGTNQVVGARVTGYTAMTGSADKATSYATSTVTLAQLAGRVMQLQADLTTHGIIGT